MGNSTQAINKVHQDVSAMTSVVNSVIQKCGSFSEASQTISIYQNCKDASVHISHVNMGLMMSLDLKCTQSAKSNQSVSTQINQVAAQMAAAVSGILGLDLSSQEAQNIASMSATVATTIVNSFSQIAESAANANQSIYITQKGEKCSVDLRVINFETILQSVTSVVQHSSTIQSAVTALVQTIKQVASAKVRSLVEMLATAFVVLVAVVLGGAALFRAVKRQPAPPALGSASAPRGAPPLVSGVS